MSQPLFIRKISSFPIANETLHWLNSYSSNRKQCVKIESELSNQFPAHSAIGQGTICGPLMFLSFFNDSDGGNGPTKSFNFADEKKIALIIKNEADTKELQKAIDNFVQWCDINGLELNIKKCKVMTFSHKKSTIRATYTIRGHPIERVEEIRDLGVIMDSKLSFNSHREFIKSKADNKLAFIKRECHKTFKLDNAKLLYRALVRSHLEFASFIWTPYQITNKITVESKPMLPH